MKIVPLQQPEMSINMKEHDIVTLNRDIEGAVKGEKGTIVHIYNSLNYAVEFDNCRVLDVVDIDILSLPEFLTKELEGCKRYLYDTALERSSEFEDLMLLNEKELPTHLNKKGWQGEVIKLRIDDKEISPSILTEVLSNCEFDYDHYRKLGKNDGRLETLSALFDFIGNKEKSLEALDYVYGE